MRIMLLCCRENLWGRPEVADVQQQMLDGLLKWYLETTDVTPLAEGATAGRFLITNPCLPFYTSMILSPLWCTCLQMMLDTRLITPADHQMKSCGGKNSIRTCTRSIKR